MKKQATPHVSRIVIFYKLALGLLELAFGLGIIIFGGKISKIYNAYKVRELLEDPHDLFIIIVQKFIPVFTHYHTYFMITLLGFGALKVVAGIAMLYEKEWGVDLLILFFFLMLPFDIYTLFSQITFLNTAYFLVNVLITLYLVQFKPHTYLLKYLNTIKRVKKRS